MYTIHRLTLKINQTCPKPPKGRKLEDALSATNPGYTSLPRVSYREVNKRSCWPYIKKKPEPTESMPRQTETQGSQQGRPGTGEVKKPVAIALFLQHSVRNRPIIFLISRHSAHREGKTDASSSQEKRWEPVHSDVSQDTRHNTFVW